MRARKCDRCGAYYDHYNGHKNNEENANGFIFIDKDMNDKYFSRNSVDLCHDCLLKLLDFMKGEQR